MANFGSALEKAIVLAYLGKPFDKRMEDVIPAAQKVAEWLKSQGITGDISHVGETNLSTSSEWQSYGGSNRSSPKTDIILGNYRMSVKVGRSQIMSAGVGEATATFKTALDKTKNLNTKLTEEIFGLFQSFVKGVSSTTVGKAKKDDLVLQQGEKVHKEMLTALTKMFDSNKDFAREFVKEAITGETKFGGGDGCPTHILSIGTKYRLYDLNNNEVYDKILKSIKLNISFKSSHLKGSGKMGGYRFWSVVGIALNKIKEGIQYTRHDDVMSEAVIDTWEKVKSFFIGLLSDIKDYISNNMQNLFDFLEVEPEIKFDNEYEL